MNHKVIHVATRGSALDVFPMFVGMSSASNRNLQSMFYCILRTLRN